MMAKFDLDDFDRRILTALQEDNMVSNERLAEQVGLSPSAVQRRAKRLREADIIVGDISVIDPALVGKALTIIVEITLKWDTLIALEEFQRRMRSAPEVQQCYYVTGNADVVLIIIADDMAEYERFVEKHFFDEKSVQRIRSNVVVNRVKTSLAVPIELRKPPAR